MGEVAACAWREQLVAGILGGAASTSVGILFGALKGKHTRAAMSRRTAGGCHPSACVTLATMAEMATSKACLITRFGMSPSSRLQAPETTLVRTARP